ncbi:hypothetical protein X777_00980 [Ooceraea biroi]|uniref:Uncharacterized protein n=1 Tax=Ooceraea biroi TaxID=2015173 RepID=A0A026WPH8_OOCBI|nr:hypothetical protein X777_00980 [Ooceraea biroi]
MRGGAGDGPSMVTVPASASLNSEYNEIFDSRERIARPRERCHDISMMLSQPNYRCGLYHRGSHAPVTIDRVRLSI